VSRLDEPRRLRAVAYATTDDSRDDELDRLVQQARALTAAPIALISLVGRRAQVFRAHSGLAGELGIACGASRSTSICQIVVATEGPVVIPDTRRDTRVPQEVVQRYDVRAYAGLPIYDREDVIGSLCVIDVVPREFDRLSVQALRELAALASRRIAELGRIRTERALRAPSDARAHTLRAAQVTVGALRAAHHAVEPIARGLQPLEHELALTVPELPSVTLSDALGFHVELERCVRDLHGAIEVLGPGHGKLLDHASSVVLLVAELAVLGRLARAHLDGALDPAAAERALRSTRDLLGALTELGAVLELFARDLATALATERSFAKPPRDAARHATLRAIWDGLHAPLRPRPFAWAAAILRVGVDVEAGDGVDEDPEIEAKLAREGRKGQASA
jgi:hypothetical protein